MSAEPDKAPAGPELADVACSAALAGIREKLLAAASGWDEARASWKQRGNIHAAAVCSTAAWGFRDIARQCQPNAIAQRPADENQSKATP